ncbi:MAG: type IV pilus modification PilV family protein [Verrucomicrobiia bacterium]|jgi:type II secretory pathway pseudopilin PulG
MNPRAHRTRFGGSSGAILLEVVIALAIFVAAAGVITVGMNAAVSSVERQRLSAHAVNLSVTVMSELRVGMRSYAPADPEPFDAPFTNWTWQVVTTPEASIEAETGFQHVEVIVRHAEPRHVFRLAELAPVSTNDMTVFEAP